MRSLILGITIASLLIFGAVGKAVENEGLVLYLPFDEGSGDSVKDLSATGNDGTIQGAKWVKDGKIGFALSFDVGDFVEIPHSESLSITDEITVMAWTNMDPGASGELAIVSKGGWAANDLPYELTQTPGGVIYWQFYDNGGRDSCSPGSPPVGEWHHIAGTYDGEVFKAYIDGEFAQEWAYAGTMPENIASVTIGKRSRGGCLFNGMIDEVAIFNRALSAEEVQKAMEGIETAVEQEGKLATSWGSIKVPY
jgi:hypothetical protein